ncbi:glycerophosphodiester phosphodiesterase [Effusibacillus pohliae]|uniref:glycerophosphodiester phosphodiesterase n=1 Tax=Effusibacillus pohliae TaxID=232270 RepID=UPI00036BCDE0|nr:glycerophosphodiester phosphodiesterase family protein [Effusibacillus pohliae]
MNNPCIAHRGWSGKAPENTFSAIRKAIEHPDIDMIELDVQMSRDGIPVLMHDYTLERTTNGSGPVGAYTLQELKKLDAGAWFGEEFAGETIPALEEVLQMVKGKKKLNIEIKRAGGIYHGIEERVVALVHKYEMQSSVIITSFNHETIRELSRLAPDLKRGLIIYGLPVLVNEQLEATGATILSMCYPYLTKEFVYPLLDRGIECIAWTIDNPEHMQQVAMIDDRIAICTNNPDRWFNLQGRICRNC